MDKTPAGIMRKLAYKTEFHVGEELILWDEVITPNRNRANVLLLI